MHRIIGMLVVCALLSIGRIATAGPFEDGISALQRGDYSTARNLLRPLAERGSAAAQNYLGVAIANGGRGAADAKESARWYRRAADQGNAEAQYNLGGAYESGLGVAENHKEALKWYRRSAEQGHLFAMWTLGSKYEFGENGVAQDFVRAHMWTALASSTLHNADRKTVPARPLTLLAAKMTPAQIEQAQAMARTCQQSNYRQCGEPEEMQTAARTSPLPAPRSAPVATAPPPSAQTAPAKTVTSLTASPQTASTDKSSETRTPAASVPMQKQGGTFVVPVLINNAIVLAFVLDSGASDVTIPADVVLTLMRTGTLTQKDFTGKKTYRLADGSTMPSETFVIRSLKVGDRVVENVMGSVAPVKGSLLLGQSFLGKFKSWSIDNTKHALVLE